MIFYNDKKIKEQIKADHKELENYKNSYSKRIALYNVYIDTMQVFEDGIIDKNKLNKEELEKKKKIFQVQINKIDSNLDLLTNLLKNIDTTGNVGIEKKAINKYNQKYKEIRNNYISNSVFEEQITENYINGLMADLSKTLERTKEEHEKEIENILTEKSNNVSVENVETKVVQEEQSVENVETKIVQGEQSIDNTEEKNKKENLLKNNNILLVSEKLGKVILPYRAEEVLTLLKNENDKYKSVEEVIEDKFVRDFSDYKIQFASRYRETMKLARERENYSLVDSVAIATEMMKKRFLHPAIISACRSLNELDVYLDCLDKNELEDFKIFKIKYELYPMVIKQSNKTKGKRFKDNIEFNLFHTIKNIFRKNNEVEKEN